MKMKTIKKSTSKITKEAKARKLYKDLTDEQKQALHLLLGRIACDDVRNFYSTRAYKNLSKEVSSEQRILISYICRNVGTLNIFEEMDDLTFTEG